MMARGNPPRSFHQPGQGHPPQSAPVAAKLQQAIAFHQKGQLESAEPLYREILARAPAPFDALHLLGVLHHQKGMHESAVELMTIAVVSHRQDPPT